MTSSNTSYLSDLLRSTVRFATLEIAIPFVIYAFVLGVLSMLGGLLDGLLKLLFVLAGLAVMLVVLGLLIEYIGYLIGIGAVIGVGALIAFAFYIGLKQLLGPLLDQILGVLSTLLDLGAALLAVLLVVAIALLVVGTAVAPFYFVLLVSAELYEADLSAPVMWAVPPLVSVGAILWWATATGFVTHNLLVLLFLSVVSLALRTSIYIERTASSSDSNLDQVPLAAAAVPLGIATVVAMLDVVDPGTLHAVEPLLHDVFTTVNHRAPFDPLGSEAVLVTLLPAAVVSVPTLLYRATTRGLASSTSSSSGSSSVSSRWSSNGSTSGSTASGGSSGGGQTTSSGGSTASNTGSSTSSSGADATSSGTADTNELSWSSLTSAAYGFDVHLATQRAGGERKLLVAFPYDKQANQALKSTTVDWLFHDPTTDRYSTDLDGVTDEKCWFARDTVDARKAISDTFGIDPASVLDPLDTDTKVFDPNDTNSTGDTKIFDPDR